MVMENSNNSESFGIWITNVRADDGNDDNQLQGGGGAAGASWHCHNATRAVADHSTLIGIC